MANDRSPESQHPYFTMLEGRTEVAEQPKRVKFTNCSQFLTHIFFVLDFHFYVIFYLLV